MYYSVGRGRVEKRFGSHGGCHWRRTRGPERETRSHGDVEVGEVESSRDEVEEPHSAPWSNVLAMVEGVEDEEHRIYIVVDTCKEMGLVWSRRGIAIAIPPKEGIAWDRDVREHGWRCRRRV